MDKIHGAITLLTLLDISRRNIERAMRAENYHSAAFLAEEMALEAEALSRACKAAAKRRHK